MHSVHGDVTFIACMAYISFVASIWSMAPMASIARRDSSRNSIWIFVKIRVAHAKLVILANPHKF